MKPTVLALVLASGCGQATTAATQFAHGEWCPEHGCEATWTADCHYVTCGPDVYDIWEKPGWRCSWACASYEGDWRSVRIRWHVEGACFTKPTVEVGNCWEGFET